MKIEDGFNVSSKTPAVTRQSAVNMGLVIAVVSMALLTGVIGYMLGMQSSSSRSLAGSQGALGGYGSSAQQPPNQTSQPTSNTPAQNQGANQTAPKTNPQPSANSASNT